MYERNGERVREKENTDRRTISGRRFPEYFNYNAGVPAIPPLNRPSSPDECIAASSSAYDDGGGGGGLRRTRARIHKRTSGDVCTRERSARGAEEASATAATVCGTLKSL